MILLAFLYRQKVVSIGDLSDDFTNSFYRRCLQIFHHRPQLAMSAEISSSSSLSSSICINLRHFYNSKTNTNICVQHIFMKIWYFRIIPWINYPIFSFAYLHFSSSSSSLFSSYSKTNTKFCVHTYSTICLF